VLPERAPFWSNFWTAKLAVMRQPGISCFSNLDTTAIIAIRGDRMSQLIVRNVGQEIVGALKRRAARHGRSAEAEHREILQAALREEVERASFKAALASMPDVGADEDFEFERDLPRPSL
jgi:plasmid stability protein